MTNSTQRMYGEADSAVDRLLTADEEYDLGTRILDALMQRVGHDFSPCQIAALPGVNATTPEVRSVLPTLAKDGHVRNSGRSGAWARWTFVWG